jgi:hypothetical protein
MPRFFRYMAAPNPCRRVLRPTLQSLKVIPGRTLPLPLVAGPIGESDDTGLLEATPAVRSGRQEGAVTLRGPSALSASSPPLGHAVSCRAALKGVGRRVPHGRLSRPVGKLASRPHPLSKGIRHASPLHATTHLAGLRECRSISTGSERRSAASQDLGGVFGRISRAVGSFDFPEPVPACLCRRKLPVGVAPSLFGGRISQAGPSRLPRA